MIPNSTKDILELKDHLITVERKVGSKRDDKSLGGGGGGEDGSFSRFKIPILCLQVT